VGVEQAAHHLTGVEFAADAYACAEDADALVIVTEWDAFRALDLDRIKSVLKEPLIVDLRNIYRPADIRAKGFRYVSIGRP
jgi:UDPglucose 6-dehydrogenase